MMDDNDYDDDDEIKLEILAESETYAILKGKDEDGEEIYNIELGTLTLHLFVDEWEEFVGLIRSASNS